MRSFLRYAGPADIFLKVDGLVQGLIRGEKDINDVWEELGSEIDDFVRDVEAIPNTIPISSEDDVRMYCRALYYTLRRLTGDKHGLLDEYYDVLLDAGIIE